MNFLKSNLNITIIFLPVVLIGAMFCTSVFGFECATQRHPSRRCPKFSGLTFGESARCIDDGLTEDQCKKAKKARALAWARAKAIMKEECMQGKYNYLCPNKNEECKQGIHNDLCP